MTAFEPNLFARPSSIPGSRRRWPLFASYCNVRCRGGEVSRSLRGRIRRWRPAVWSVTSR